MILYDPRAANAPSPRMRRAKTPFARCPCTKPAICAGVGAGAVNHPHHINCMNHSSNKCQPALIHALTPVNPSIRRQRASSAPCTRPPRPRRRPSPATRLPSCAENFFAQSLANSRELSSISRTRANTCATPPSAAEEPPARPVPGPRRARPSPATASAVLRPKFLAQSHTISRNLSCNAHPSRLPVNPFNRPKNASNLNPV